MTKKAAFLFILILLLAGCGGIHNKTGEKAVQTFIGALIDGDVEKIEKMVRFDEFEMKDVITLSNEYHLIGANQGLCEINEVEDFMYEVLCETTDEKQLLVDIRVNQEKKGFFIYDYDFRSPIKITYREDELNLTKELKNGLELITGKEYYVIDDETKKELRHELLNIAEIVEELYEGSPERYVDYLDDETMAELDDESHISQSILIDHYLDEYEDYHMDWLQVESIEVSSYYDNLVGFTDVWDYIDNPEDYRAGIDPNGAPFALEEFLMLLVKFEGDDDEGFHDSFVQLYLVDDEWKILPNDYYFSFYMPPTDFVNYGLYQGKWKDGLMHGEGKSYWPLDNYEEIYEGSWREGELDGEGKLYWMLPSHYYIEDDDLILYYHGNFENDKKHGPGTSYYDDGTIKYQGDWIDDQYHGKGTLYNEDGIVLYEGDFENGNPKLENVEITVKEKEIQSYEAVHNEDDEEYLLTLEEGETIYFPIIEGNINSEVLDTINNTLQQELEDIESSVEWVKDAVDAGEFDYYFSDYEIAYQSDEYLSIVFRDSRYRLIDYISYNFRLYDGELLSIDDVVTEYNISDDKLNDEIISGLSRDGYGPYHDFEEYSYYQAFHFTDEGLVILFSSSSILPDPHGAVELPVSWDQLIDEE